MEATAAVEIDVPFVFPALIGRAISPDFELDVIVNDALIDDSAGEPVSLEGPDILGVFDIGGIGDDVVSLEGIDRGRRVGDGGCTGTDGTGPGGGTIVNEVGEVRLLVVGVGDGLRISERISEGELVADETAVGLERRGKNGGEDRVASDEVTCGAIIHHGDGGPCGQVAGVGFPDVGPGIDRLVGEGDCADAVWIGDAGGDGDGDAGGGLGRGVRDLADLGWDEIESAARAVRHARGGSGQVIDGWGEELGVDVEI